MKKSLAVIICICMLIAAFPFAASAASSSSFTYKYEVTGNSGAVITVDSGNTVTASVSDTSIATATVNGSVITVTGVSGAVGIAEVSVTCAGVVCKIDVPIGYTTFLFNGDSVKVIPGSSDKYSVSAISQAGTETTPTGVTGDDGYVTYSNTTDSKILINIKAKGGTYAFYGTGNDMGISVNKEATNPAVLLFEGLTLTSSFTSPITIKKDSTSTVTITALAGHVNTITDAALNNADVYGATTDGGNGTNATFAESAVIKAKTAAKLTLNGEGTLNLVCNSKNAIKTGQSGTLTISDLTLNVTSADNGISSDNTMTIQSGTITVNAKSDGIRSNPDTVSADTGYAGNIVITGGTINVVAGSDAIQASQNVTISGGIFTLQTGSGYNDSTFDGKTMSCKGIKASANATDTTTSGTTTTTTTTTTSTNTIEITGGTFNINTADDGIHSDGYIVITGGTFAIKTGDDGVHADTSLTLGTSGATDNTTPKIVVSQCYEGLEAGTVYIYSGTYRIFGSDDGINAAGGSSSGDNFNPGGGPGRPGQGTNPGGSSSSSSYAIYIYGGKVFVDVEGDGIDANGTISLLGGTIVSWGQKAGGDNEPLDSDGDLTIKGATVFAAGSSMMTTTPTSSSQAYVRYSSSTYATGKTINVKYNGTTVYNAKAIKDVNYVLYSSPSMTSSSGWTITADTSSLLVPDYTLTALNSTVIDSSSSLIYGVEPGITSLDGYVSTSEDCSLSYTQTANGFGTGTVVNVIYNNETVETYTLLIYGDVNGDGMYDATDALIVNLLANGVLTKQQVGTAQYAAADCNHDSAVDSSDASLLEQAGVFLSEVDQTKSLTSTTAGMNYLNVISQTIPTDDTTSSDTDTDSAENNSNSIFSIISRILKAISSIIEKILNLIK